MMKPSYFVSERVRLRAMEPEDLEIMYAMENDPQTWDVTNFSVPYSKYVLRQYMENSQCDMFADRDYAFGFLFLKQLVVHVAADNEASLRLFGSCGFVQCGLLKEWWFAGGKFKDVVLMQCIRLDSVGRVEDGR